MQRGVTGKVPPAVIPATVTIPELSVASAKTTSWPTFPPRYVA